MFVALCYILCPHQNLIFRWLCCFYLLADEDLSRKRKLHLSSAEALNMFNSTERYTSANILVHVGLSPVQFTFPDGLSECLYPVTAQTADTHPDWTIDVPSTVKGLPGSCVVIPCSFKYPKEEKAGTHTGMWWNENNQYIYHSEKSKVIEEYRSRTTLLGDLREKKCSLKIDPLLQSDQGPFYFRIEITNVDKYSYKNNKVSIKMISKYWIQQLFLTVQIFSDVTSYFCHIQG